MKSWIRFAFGCLATTALPLGAFVLWKVKYEDEEVDEVTEWGFSSTENRRAGEELDRSNLSNVLSSLSRFFKAEIDNNTSNDKSNLEGNESRDEFIKHTRLKIFKRRPHVEYPHASVLAQRYPNAVRHIRETAESSIGRPLPSRFTDAELMRYAIHHGYLRASDDFHREKALIHAIEGVIASEEWFSKYNFSSKKALDRFSNLLWWEIEGEGPKHSFPASKTNDKSISRDRSGEIKNENPLKRPVLHVKLGQAVHAYKGIEALAFADAIIAQVEYGLKEVCSEDPSLGYDRVDVVIYASGASTFAASRVARVLKSVVSILSRHYPGRLHELTLLDLPKVLNWILRGATKIVHAETARKVHSLTMEEWQKKMAEEETK